jgi:hypothetical protein
MKIKKFAVHFIPILLICIVSFRNLVPEGYIVGGGDFVQWFNFSRQFSNFTYAWANESLGYGHIARPYFLYYLLATPLIQLFGLSVSEHSLFYYMSFLLPAYFSFYLAASYYEGQVGEIGARWKAILATGYVFNIFTFYNFYGLWGYSPFLFLYVLIPIIFALTHRYFIRSEVNYIDLAFLGIIFCFVNIPNGNFPFFVSLIIILFIYGIVLVKINHLPNAAKKFISLFLIISAATSWSVLPQLPELINGLKFIVGGNKHLGMDAWVLGQSVKFPDPFFIANDYNSFSNFPFLIQSSVALLIAAILVALMGHHRVDTKKSIFALFFMYLLTIFLLNKGSGILPDWLILTLFSNNFMGALRSFHKTIIYLPFFLYMIILFGLSIRGQSTILIKILVILAITPPLAYFLRGEILVNYSFNYAAGENYMTSDVAPILKIPDDYVNASVLLNQDDTTHRILSAPYSLSETTYGWRRIPAWKYLGTSDPVWQLFNAPFVQINDSSLLKGWEYGKQWHEESASESKWIVPLAGLMNVKYILFHKDVEKRFWLNDQKKMNAFVKDGLLEFLTQNSFFTIYKLNPKFINPRLYMPRNIRVLDNISHLSGALDVDEKIDAFFFQRNMPDLFKTRIHEISTVNGATLEYERVNPTKYRVRVSNAKGAFAVILLEAFRDEWSVYLSDDNEFHAAETNRWPIDGGTAGPIARAPHSLFDGKYYETWFSAKISNNKNHHLANGFANSWIIDAATVCAGRTECTRNPDGSYDLVLVLEYWPQQLIYIGKFLSLLTFFFCLFYIAYRWQARLLGSLRNFFLLRKG